MRLAVSLVLAFVAALFTVTLVSGLGGDPQPQGGPQGTINTIAADMNIAGNGPNSPLGEIDECQQVEAGGTLTFDVIVDSVHPVDGIKAFNLQITYVPGLFQVVQVQGEMMLAANPNSDVQVNNDPLPDTDGNLTIVAQELNPTSQPEFGQGVLARITLQNTGDGDSDITIANATITGGNNQPIPIGNPPKKGRGGRSVCVTPSPSPTPTPTPTPTPSPSPTASPNPFTHPIPPNFGGPSEADRGIYGQKLSRLRSHAHELPIGIDDALKSLSETVTIEFDCPKPPSKVSKVVINITTTIVDWDADQAVPGSAGTYDWNVTTKIENDVKTYTAKNWLMMDPNVMAEQEAAPPFGPVVDEALLYHELLHGQLQMNYMKTQEFKDKACECKYTEQGEAHEHGVITGAVNGYFEERFPGGTVDIVEGKTKVDEDGNFEKDLGPVNKNPWVYTAQDPEGGSNIGDLDVVEENGRWVLKGTLIDKTKPGKILIQIDPDNYLLLGGFDEFLIFYPPGETRVWGDIDCDGDADADDAIIALISKVDVDVEAPATDCPSLAQYAYIDGLERPWGDADCDDEITFFDALIILQNGADVEPFEPFECPAVGSEVNVSAIGG